MTDAATQQPVASAQVLIVGTPFGALTDEEGRYRLGNVAPGAKQLRAVRIGYQQATQPVTLAPGQSATADFTLSATVVKIDEVVVTATGEQQRKRETGNTVATIQPAAELLTSTTNLTDVLTARTPGVYVQQSGGTTGTASRIRIRGANSVSLVNEPLLVIDGVRASNDVARTAAEGQIGVGGQGTSRLNDINPDDIENVEIIKGPAAAALYGTAAANGVIQIRTKRGKAGKTRWSGHVEGGTLYDVQNYPANYRQIGRTTAGARTTNCNLDSQARRLCTPVQDSLVSWNPLKAASPFQEGYRGSFGVNAAGGTDVSTYFLSGEFEKEQGVYDVSKLRRANLRANLRSQLRDNFDASISTGYVQSRLRLPQNDNNTLGQISAGLLGNAFDDSIGRGYLNRLAPTATSNIDTREDIDRFTGSVTTNYQPFRWLTAVAVAGLDFVDRHTHETVPPNKVPFGSLPEGERRSNPFRIYNYTANGGFTATWGITEAVRSQTSVGVQFQKELVQGTRAFGAKLIAGGGSLGGTSARFSVAERNTDNKTLGGYLQEQIAWKDRVFLTGALRSDNNSAFGQRFGYITYPSVSASWVISEEPFFPETRVMSNLRLRAAYGESGQRPSFRDAITFFDPVTVAISGVDVPGIVIGGIGNFDLKPERSKELEGGFEAGFLNQRIGVELTYYRKRTEDALIARPIPPSAGGAIERFENLGRVSNRGWEFQVNASVVNLRRVKFDLTLSGSTNRNRLEELGEGIIPIVFGRQSHVPGYPLGGYWQVRIDSLRDINSDGIISRVNCPTNPFTGFSNPQIVGGPACELFLSDTVQYLGNPLPTREWSVAPSLQLFNWLKVTALVDHKGGFKLFNNTRRFRCNFFNCVEAQDANTPLADQAANLAQLLGTDGGYIEDATYTKLRELAITLTAPRGLANRFRVEGLALTIAGRNLKTWTDYSGFDPEVNSQPTANFSSSDFLTQPPVRFWTARLNFTW